MRSMAVMAIVLCRVHLVSAEGEMHADTISMDDLGTVSQWDQSPPQSLGRAIGTTIPARTNSSLMTHAIAHAATKSATQPAAYAVTLASFHAICLACARVFFFQMKRKREKMDEARGAPFDRGCAVKGGTAAVRRAGAIHGLVGTAYSFFFFFRSGPTSDIGPCD